MGVFRPVSRKELTFYAQFGLGLSLTPLRTENITSVTAVTQQSARGVVDYQFTQYTSVGLQFLERFAVGLTLPVTWGQSGANPDYGTGSILGSNPFTTVDTTGPAVSDTRLDLRAVAFRSADKRTKFGASLSIFFPTGNRSLTNFGGEGEFTPMIMVQGEHSWRYVTFTGNLGFHFRPKKAINDPTRNNGLGVSDEVRLALGVYVPVAKGKYRVGLNIYSQTGIVSDPVITGQTAFTAQNTPVEWQLEGRMKLGPKNEYWLGAGAGSYIWPGYGAADFRSVLSFGVAIPLTAPEVRPPDPREQQIEEWRQARKKKIDTDGDGMPDDEDACPTVAEDGKAPDPTDGCPAPPDSDGDGIPDPYDKCPDRAEDMDGIEDGDGCPEDDFDMDGVPDTEDACPREPGKPATDPKKNGCAQFIKFTEDRIVILDQVHFKTGSAEILPKSFPMLMEIADVLKANMNIKRLLIEGHTDNTGTLALNTRLSQERADSVRTWLINHGIAEDRLEAEGFGPTRPIDTNATQKGRDNNRRVEFKVLDEADLNKPNMPQAPTRPTPTPADEDGAGAQAPPPKPAPPPPPRPAPKPAPKSAPAEIELD
jgi:outer membrane protein OmpA-like peptidoglycan-associated protein